MGLPLTSWASEYLNSREFLEPEVSRSEKARGYIGVFLAITFDITKETSESFEPASVDGSSALSAGHMPNTTVLEV